jgi:hypothetical protein
MKRALIYIGVSAAMIASIAVAGIFGPLIVSAVLSLAARRYQKA